MVTSSCDPRRTWRRLGEERHSSRMALNLSNSAWLARRNSHWGVYRGQPIVAIRLSTAGQGKKFVLQFAGDRAGYAFPNCDVINRSDWSYLYRRSHEEYLIDDVEHFSRNNRFFYRNAKIFSKLDDAIARDSWQDAGRERRGVKRVIVDEKHIHSRAFAYVTSRIERDAFGVPIEGRFHANQLRIHVVCRRFGHGRKSVGSDASPGTDTDVHSVGKRFGTEVCSP